MDVFEVHQQLLADYEAFTSGFTTIHDPRIREHIERRLANGDQWPDAYLSLNPNFAVVQGVFLNLPGAHEITGAIVHRR